MTTLDAMGVLVTGGGSGIGLACARRLAADGAVVTICGRNEDRLRAAIDQMRAERPDARVHHVVADVTDEDAVSGAVDAATEAAGNLGGVVSNAGGATALGPVTHLEVEGWRATLDLNLTGTMLVIKHGAAAMVRGGGGSIVAMSSFAGSTSHRWFGAYGPGKAGIDQLCRQAADELGPSGVRVNAVAPGLIRTELMSFVTDGGAVLDDYVVNTPLGRIGEPEDVAELVRFLVGPESAWITGQRINVDGGQSLRRGPDFSALFEPLYNPGALRGVTDG